MAQEIFIQISLLMLIVLAVSLIMRILSQPLIIGYIISGVIVGPYLLGILPGIQAIDVFSEFGIAFLLFVVGLHLSPKVIKEVGKISLITGMGQILFTSLFGYLISIALGFNHLTSLYIAIALTFSSTIIIMKLLSDKRELNSLYGKISIGFLLIQDLFVIFILILISSLSSGGNILIEMGVLLLKGLGIVAVLAPISLLILPKYQNFFGKSQEFLFVFSLAWGLGIAALFYYAGLSVEIGALVAGVLLSVSPYNYSISSKLKPLRDFFLISFFLVLGSQIVVSNISSYILPAIILSLFVLIGNPIIVMILMGANGYTKRTGFLAGLTVAQISEFSLILITLGMKVGHVSKEILSFVTLIGIITIAFSTYMILYSSKLYHLLSKYLSIFEKKNVKKKKEIEENVDSILFGYNKTGYSILNSLKKIKRKSLIIDFNPDTIASLKKYNIPCMYADAYDPEILNDLPLEKIKTFVSTIPGLEANLLLLKEIRKRNKKATIVLRARTIDESLKLYEGGANYVITPQFLGGEYVAKMINRSDKEDFSKEKEKHIKMLRKVRKQGLNHI